MTAYAALCADQITPALFEGFRRWQAVSRCWRKIDGQWVIRDIAFLEDWTATDYDALVAALKATVAVGGLVAGAFVDGRLKGFACVEPALFGRQSAYMQLASLHVSQELRGKGLGSALFAMAKDWALAHGAQKLYISAHSAIETQAFYRAQGCVEAREYNQALAAAEPCDCQLECPLT